MPLTFGQLGAILEREGRLWHTPPLARPDQLIEEHRLGGDPRNLPRAADAPRLELRAMLQLTANPFLAARRVELGIAGRDLALESFNPQLLRRLGLEAALAEPQPPRGARAPRATGAAPPPPSGGAPATAVDWRHRWGRNWITTIRDQDGCASCWAFAGVALIEAMVKIEHAMWTRLSEGDVHKGVGSPCANGNNMGTVSNFFRDHGIADPACFPYHTDDVPYTPTPDRNGRSVRGPAFTFIGDIGQQKTWIDSVGPIVTWFDVWHDFDGYASGVYHKSNDPSNYQRGGHFLLVVGYDDATSCWICKNSWGQGWGDGGYVRIGYGESGVDQYAKCGVQDVNPDPWTKRRLHNGNLYESGNGGLHRNLEVAGATAGKVTHHWREGGPPWTWKVATQFANDAAVCPTYTGTTFNRNMEIVYLTTNHRLHHWWVEGGGGAWHDGGVFGPNDCQGVPGFIQGSYNAPGNFEVVVKVGGGQLQHVWRDGGGWHDGPRFGSNIAYSGPSLVEGQYGTPHGNLECVAVLGTGAMQHFWRTENNFQWHAGVLFGSGIGSTPAMIQGQYGMENERGIGNFELCVAAGGRVQHWWRNNQVAAMTWHHGATFGHDVQAVAGLCESSWGMNLEVIVLRTDGQLQHYWRDGVGWHEGPVIGPA